MLDRGRSSPGYVVLYVVATLALFASTLVLGPVLAAPSQHGDALLFLCACVAVAGGALAIEARRDLYAFCQYMIVLTFGIAVVGGAILAMLDPRNGGLWALVLLAATAGTLATWHVLRTQFGKDDIPNLLRDRFTRQSIVEDNGVQWAGIGAGGELASTGRSTVTLVFQSCVDAPREVRLALKVNDALLDARSPLRAPVPPPFELRGGQVVAVTIPVAGVGVAGQIDLFIEPTIRGSGGRRIRKWRAQAATRRTSAAKTALLALAAGIYVWGGGFRFRLFLPAIPGAARDEILESQHETLFPSNA